MLPDVEGESSPEDKKTTTREEMSDDVKLKEEMTGISFLILRSSITIFYTKRKEDSLFSTSINLS